MVLTSIKSDKRKISFVLKILLLIISYPTPPQS